MEPLNQRRDCNRPGFHTSAWAVATALELTGAPLDLGLLGVQIRHEHQCWPNDILDQPAGITTPHITDGGNLTLEFTIQAADVVGAAQVFSSSFGFGVYPLFSAIPSTPGVKSLRSWWPTS